jgi:hypothetical protein
VSASYPTAAESLVHPYGADGSHFGRSGIERLPNAQDAYDGPMTAQNTYEYYFQKSLPGSASAGVLSSRRGAIYAFAHSSYSTSACSSTV